MKTSYLVLGFCLIGMSQVFFSCQDNEINSAYTESTLVDSEYLKGNVYPLSKEYQQMAALTRASESTFETNWENTTEVTLASGKSVSLPWADTSDANVSVDLALDIKKEDGWQLLFHTFVNSGVENRGRNYMIFHNLRTGLLKVFYYLEAEYTPNNFGSWQLSFTTPHQLFNFTTEIADPKSMGKINYWGCTNAIASNNKGFARGWNCLHLMLSYDDSYYTERRIDINTNNLNTADFNIFGEYKSHSTGTIITHGSSNPLSDLTGDLANVFGTEGGNWLDKAISKGDLKSKDSASTRSVLLAGAASAVLKYGANKIFSKLTASFSKPTVTRSDLDFSTKGTSQSTGTITFNATSPVLSLRTLFTKEKVGELGSWNLTEIPTVYVDPRADYVPTDNDIYYKEYWYKTRGISKYKYNLIINPQLQSHIIDKWVDIDLICYRNSSMHAPKIPDYYTDFGTLGGNRNGFGEYYSKEDLIYGQHKEDNAIYNKKLHGYLYVRDIYAVYKEPIPVILVPKVVSYESHYFNSNNIFMKMTLGLVTDFEGKRDTTISTRTFIPKIEWDQDLYNKLDHFDMKELVHYDWIK